MSAIFQMTFNNTVRARETKKHSIVHHNIILHFCAEGSQMIFSMLLSLYFYQKAIQKHLCKLLPISILRSVLFIKNFAQYYYVCKPFPNVCTVASHGVACKLLFCEMS